MDAPALNLVIQIGGEGLVGKFSSIDAPDAGTNGASLQGTVVLDINPEGEVAGEYLDSANVSHAFVRHCDGVITTFEAPGAGVGPGQGTFTPAADGLNSEGALSGEYLDDLNVYHGYIRARDGRSQSWMSQERGPARSKART